MYQVELTPEAIDDLAALRKFDQVRIVAAIEAGLTHGRRCGRQKRKRIVHPRREIRAMKTINLPQASEDVTRLLNEARQDDVVVKLADGSEFMVIAIDEFDQEIAKSRSNPRLMALLEARAAQTATVALDEVKRRLDL
jgi:hypothetical protein